MISPSILQQIIDRIDLADFISRYVTVNRNLKAVCPFHDETKPSLSIHPSRKFFKCFGCDTKGNIFAFIKKIEGVTFIEAVRIAANSAGVSLPKSKRFQGYITRHWEEKKKKLSYLKDSKWIFRQAVLGRYDELLHERKSLPQRFKWDSWNAKVYLREQFIDYQFDRLDEKERKINEEFNEEKRRILNV